MKRLALILMICLTLLPAGTAAGATIKYALSTFHFNIQYVAGGMVGFLPWDAPAWELNAEAIEDMIVVESFEPVIDLYGSHPEWGVHERRRYPNDQRSLLRSGAWLAWTQSHLVAGERPGSWLPSAGPVDTRAGIRCVSGLRTVPGGEIPRSHIEC